MSAPADHIQSGPPTELNFSQNILEDSEDPDVRLTIKKKRMRKSHILFPLVVTPNCVSIVEADGYSFDMTPARCQSASPTPTNGRVSSLSITTEENLSDAFSPTLSSCNSSTPSTPFPSPPITPALLCSPTDVCFVSSDTSPHADQSARDLEIWQGIGELGIRRGFKGSPLFTAAIDSKSTFLAVPSTSSPRTPRTPLITMSNLMKPSPSKLDKQRLAAAKQASPAFQEDFDLHDPFRTNSDSYYSPKVVHTVSSANMENFLPYQSEVWERTPSLKRKPAITDLHSPSQTQSTFKKPGLTNIYDFSIYQYDDRPPTRTTARFKSKSSQKARQCDPVQIMLTPPSDPFSPKSSEDSVDDVLRKVMPSTVNCQDFTPTVPVCTHNTEDSILGIADDTTDPRTLNVKNVQDNEHTVTPACKADYPVAEMDTFIRQKSNSEQSIGGVAGLENSTARGVGHELLGDASARGGALSEDRRHQPQSVDSHSQDCFGNSLDRNSEVLPVCQTLSSPKRTSGLRRLVLPLQVAQRDAAIAAASTPSCASPILISHLLPLAYGPQHLASLAPIFPSQPWSPPISNHMDKMETTSVNKTSEPATICRSGRHSKALDDILALLATADYSIVPKESMGALHQHQCEEAHHDRDGHWSDELLEAYAI